MEWKTEKNFFKVGWENFFSPDSIQLITSSNTKEKDINKSFNFYQLIDHLK